MISRDASSWGLPLRYLAITAWATRGSAIFPDSAAAGECRSPHQRAVSAGQCRPGIAQLALSRWLEDTNYDFAGNIGGTLRLSYFRRLFEDSILGRYDTITLLSTDGTVLVRQPIHEGDIAKSLADGYVSWSETHPGLLSRQRRQCFTSVARPEQGWQRAPVMARKNSGEKLCAVAC